MEKASKATSSVVGFTLWKYYVAFFGLNEARCTIFNILNVLHLRQSNAFFYILNPENLFGRLSIWGRCLINECE